MRTLKGFLAAIALIGSIGPAFAAELVMYRRQGCPYCEAFDREIDIHAGDKSVVLQSPIRYTPTFVLVEGGRERARIEGYPGDFFFWPRLENLLP